ncbi:hypothetical protein [Pseudoprimorskyibacter insulae]|uniref:Uncharacterized protein n=1 Tax=Pseudoprimorskyibacter insulae TaxID=1695997 RepID=A0A2R8ANT9_9RHOB|nr:hypothetical protein [Pseudoprimorskyibacter insulae]SPF77640.1 hypothetical protein PRI8871_00224 [Pseudoprimorskyibacter insulae]
MFGKKTRFTQSAIKASAMQPAPTMPWSAKRTAQHVGDSTEISEIRQNRRGGANNAEAKRRLGFRLA